MIPPHTNPILSGAFTGQGSVPQSDSLVVLKIPACLTCSTIYGCGCSPCIWGILVFNLDTGKIGNRSFQRVNLECEDIDSHTLVHTS